MRVHPEEAFHVVVALNTYLELTNPATRVGFAITGEEAQHRRHIRNFVAKLDNVLDPTEKGLIG